MNSDSPYLDDEFLVEGVMGRRCLAWGIDLLLIGLLMATLWWFLFWLGILTLGLGFAALVVLPWVPFFYNMLSLLRAECATPGQQICGLTVRRNYDLGPPNALQALISTAAYYVTLGTSGLLLLLALITVRHRTLHDLLSGLVVVRTRAIRALTRGDLSWNIGSGRPIR